MSKRLFSLLLCFMVTAGLCLPAFAAESEGSAETAVTQIRITSAEELLAFGAGCRLDSYSRSLFVTLEQDIDLSDVSFVSIPVFSGVFDGRGHTISGLSISSDGSVQGLFRYLTADAVVKNLTVKGEIHPGGTRSKIGAIAGQNEGQILNCGFTGSLSGADYIGGIAGINKAAGVIENCHTDGNIHGDHFVGGIAGENAGVIRSCTARGQINTSPQQNSVDISDITMETLTNTEAVNTVTDIGGIAGISTGVIFQCANRGDVGYQHMGYNIGGIAGTQSGYIGQCTNFGSIQGRKEVGGIVGQMEPVALIEFSQDTLQILQEQLNTMSGLVTQASGNAQTGAAQIGVLHDQAQTARDALDTLFPDADNPEMPDPDSLLAAQNTLSTMLGAMPETLRGITSSTQTTVSGLSRDLRAVSAQINAMSETVNDASAHLGGSVTDISDLDTADTLTGKAESCINHGTVLADLNAGGIAGAIAMENDLDILEDWEQQGEESLNFHSQIRAVILSCENQGSVICRKQNAGGIVGWQSLGLVKFCTNTGSTGTENTDYVGGIAGLSSGYMRNNYAKCRLYASSVAGGIAGSGTLVTDCISIVQFHGGSEKLGAILGEAVENQLQQEADPIRGNLYPVLSADIGAIDGISYAGLAEGMPLQDFLELEALPELFRSVHIHFIFDSSRKQVITLRPGEALSSQCIPSIPRKEGFIGTWDGLDASGISSAEFDMTFTASYTPCQTVVQSQAVRENGLPVLVLEGSFSPEDRTEATLAELPVDPLIGKTLLETWDLTLPDGTAVIRFLLPEGMDAERISLHLRDAEGVWADADFLLDGSYLVFAPPCGITQLSVAESSGGRAPMVLPAVAVFLAAGVLLLIFVRRRASSRRAVSANTLD